jgi:hypothetical protein
MGNRRTRGFNRDTDQVLTVGVSPEELMRPPDFERGFNEARAGKRPNYDIAFRLMPLDPHESPYDGKNNPINWQWAYERGRLFAVLAPNNMPLYVRPTSKSAIKRKQLNPSAVDLFGRWCREDYIL